MKVKIKKLHKDAVIPKYAKAGDGIVAMMQPEIFEVREYDVHKVLMELQP